MMQWFRALDQRLDRLTRGAVSAVSACGVLIVGAGDYLTGYDVSMSLFYMGPVAIAAWYGGRRVGIAIAVLSCLSWYFADTASGHPYSHPAIPVWNALIRLGFFVINGMLLTALRNSLLDHQILARTDALTGLYGRRAFDDRLKHDLALAQRRKSLLTIAYVDVDDFKTVNDTHGHAGGDRVLQLIAKVLNGAARASDTAARVGGDEFALLLPDTDNRGAQLFISKLTRALQDTLEANNWAVTVSIGVVTVLDSATSAERAVAAADGLMFKVKESGKSAVAFSLLGEVVEPSVAERGC